RGQQLRNSEATVLSDPVVEAKETRPPPRYNEGTLIDAMQNAWRFVEDEALRERLKEAKGIGTPATRAEIIRGLKAQEFLAAQGKNIVPTERGLILFDVLQKADPALVDPGVTAQLERLLDEVLVGTTEMMGAIDAVCAQASRIIGRLTEHAASGATPLAVAYSTQEATGPERPPTAAMKAYVISLAKQRSCKPPRGYASSASICRAFLDKHAVRKASTNPEPPIAAQRASRSRRRPTSELTDPAVPVAKKLSKGKARTSEHPRTKPDPPVLPTSAAPADVRLNIPYGNKETAQKLGARYRDGAWYGPAGVDLAQFRDRGWI
ncbi:MAG: DNA topoisomerase III, partial [Oxalobacteraceae bacterium]